MSPVCVACCTGEGPSSGPVPDSPDEPAACRRDHGLQPARNAELAQDPADVALDGRRGDIQPPADELVRKSFAEQGEHFGFPGRQAHGARPAASRILRLSCTLVSLSACSPVGPSAGTKQSSKCLLSCCSPVGRQLLKLGFVHECPNRCSI